MEKLNENNNSRISVIFSIMAVLSVFFVQSSWAGSSIDELKKIARGTYNSGLSSYNSLKNSVPTLSVPKSLSSISVRGSLNDAYTRLDNLSGGRLTTASTTLSGIKTSITSFSPTNTLNTAYKDISGFAGRQVTSITNGVNGLSNNLSSISLTNSLTGAYGSLTGKLSSLSATYDFYKNSLSNINMAKIGLPSINSLKSNFPKISIPEISMPKLNINQIGFNSYNLTSLNSLKMPSNFGTNSFLNNSLKYSFNAAKLNNF